MAEFHYQAVPGSPVLRRVVPAEFWQQQSRTRDGARLEKASQLKEQLKSLERRPSYAFDLEFKTEYDMRVVFGDKASAVLGRRLKSTELIYIPTEKRDEVTQLSQEGFQIGPQNEKWGVFFPWYGLAVVYTQGDFVCDALATAHERTHTIGDSFLIESVASKRSGSAATIKLGYSLERPDAISRGMVMEEGVVSWSAIQTVLRQYPDQAAVYQQKTNANSPYESLVAMHARHYRAAIQVIDELVQQSKQKGAYLSAVFEHDLLRGRVEPSRLAVAHEIDKVAFAGAARELFALPFEETAIADFHRKLITSR